MNPLFSMIVPIYNAEETLPECLVSIRQQTFLDYEVILVDDGSEGRSPAICDDLARRDERFKVIHQKNSGPSKSRNAGIECAQGEFLIFVDSDDSINRNLLEEVRVYFEKHPDTDVVFWGYTAVDRAGNSLFRKIPNVSSTETKKISMELSDQNLFGYSWLKAYRRETIGNIRYPEGMSLLEDEVFTCRVIQKAAKVGLIPKALYNYRIEGSGSLIGKTRQNYCELLDRVYQEWINLIGTEDSSFLKEKASHMVDNCQYYYFERDLNEKEFLYCLRNSNFFQKAEKESGFAKALQESNLTKIQHMRRNYRLKVKLSRWIKGAKQ